MLDDPTAVGVLESYVNAGQLAKAADLLKDAEARGDKDGDDAAHQRVESQIKEHELLANVSQLGEQVSDLQHTLNSVLSRLSKVESRPAAAPAQAVVKAARFGRDEADPRNTAQGLMTRAEGVVDSPAQIGTLSSMLQAGRLDEARQIIEKAELAHESRMKARDRRFL